MTDDALLLVGRDTGQAREVVSTHAQRLRDREVADAVHVALHGDEPIRDLREALPAIGASTVYAVPMCLGHTYETRDTLPGALSYVPGEVHYCEPLGRSPALTSAIVERTAEHLDPGPDATLLLVGFGSSSLPYQRQATEYHAARLRHGSEFAEVVTCYLLQNPTVECARYNVSTERAVAVPLFLARNEATEEEIPAKLELERGAIEYAAPLGDHSRVTDAVHAEVEKQRTLLGGETTGTGSFEASLTDARQPVATDGEGPISGPTDEE